MILFDYTLLVVVLGTSLLGLVSGSLGCFAVLRKQSLLGDAISHAALPGIALMFLTTYSKSPYLLLLGAFLAGWIGTLFVGGIVKHTTIKEDAALGIILSVFFGFGLVLLTFIQRLPTANQSGLTTFLFGSAATLLVEDVVAMGVLGISVLVVMIVCWKEFKLLTFDREFCHSIGFGNRRLDIALTTLIVIAIVIGLQTVGVVLMSAMIIAPAAAARQWTDSLGVMVALSAFFGALSGVLGALVSSAITNLPTGPTVVVFVSIFVLISLLFAPRRGLIWGYIRLTHNRRHIRSQAMLENMLLFSESDTDPFYPHDLAHLTAIGRGPARKAMADLKARGLAVNPEGDLWALTALGLQEAKRLSAERFGDSDEY